ALAGTTLFVAGPLRAAPGSSCTATGPQNLVYPGDPNWTADLRGAGNGAITGANPRSGNGSLELTTAAHLTDWAFIERFAPAGGWGLLSQINCLTFEWYRQLIPTPTDVPWSAQTPVLRLFIQDGQQQSELVWEKYYTDASPAVTGQWISQDVFKHNLWRYVTGQGYTIAQCANVDPFFPNPLLTYSVVGW